MGKVIEILLILLSINQSGDSECFYAVVQDKEKTLL